MPGEYAAGGHIRMPNAVQAVLEALAMGVRSAAFAPAGRQRVHHDRLPRSRRCGTPDLGRPHRRHHGPGRATARPARLAAGAQLQPEYVRALRAPSGLACSRRRHSPCPPWPMAPRGRRPGPGAAVARNPRSRAGNLLDTVNRSRPEYRAAEEKGPLFLVSGMRGNFPGARSRLSPVTQGGGNADSAGGILSRTDLSGSEDGTLTAFVVSSTAFARGGSLGQYPHTSIRDL